MATVPEVRAAVGAANQTIEQGIGALRAATEHLNEAVIALHTAVQTSAHPEGDQAVMMVRLAVDKVTEAMQVAYGAIQSAQKFSTTL